MQNTGSCLFDYSSQDHAAAARDEITVIVWSQRCCCCFYRSITIRFALNFLVIVRLGFSSKFQRHLFTQIANLANVQIFKLVSNIILFSFFVQL